jgi:rSAM/selenodomain-associated transferase 1
MANVELEVRFDGGDEPSVRDWLGINGLCRPQQGGDLGKRMANAFQDSFREGVTATIIVGSDCPGLNPALLATAFESLSRNALVFGPAHDGGYYLIGLRYMVPELFCDISWGSETVLAESLTILTTKGLNPMLLEPLGDVDRPEDLSIWEQIVSREDAESELCFPHHLRNEHL